jgi:UDP-N-acetylmuramate dehydrogenase
MRIANAPLADYTRFGLGGPADLLIDTPYPHEFLEELRTVEGPSIVLGGGTNLVVSDEGFRGTALRFSGSFIERDGNRLLASAGTDLEDVVTRAIEEGLGGIESLMRIPGWVGGAIYGNAGAYGQSIHEVVERVEIFDGQQRRWISNRECEFAYRTSGFKRRKGWLILSAEFLLRPGDRSALAARAEEIRATRDAKFPPTMKCAGSIFKNCFFRDLPPGAQDRVPPALVREGKVPSAFFLEQVGAKGMVKGGIRVADYHANLIYNAGAGKAMEVVAIIDDLKQRVREEFGFALEEEVQFVGFPDRASY